MGISPNEKITLGIIGVAGRGYDAHLKTFQPFPDVEIVAVCDVYQPHLDRAVAATGGRAKAYKDYHELIAHPGLDAVVVATPPHWHPLQTVAALNAGKDVLVEKPISLFPGEAKAMTDAAIRNSRVTQVGTQVHATKNYHRVVDIVRSGVLGKITAVRNFCTMNDNSEGLGNPADEAPPSDLDWEAWLGPGEKFPYNPGLFRDGMHRYFKACVHSWLNELGPHIVDLPVWALNLPQPSAVTAVGGRFATESIATVPDTMDVIWEYPEMLMTWTMTQANSFSFGVGPINQGGRRIGVVFQGTEGTLLANYGLCELYDKKGNRIDEGREFPQTEPIPESHEREFVDAIRTRTQPSCSLEKHLPLGVALNLAHVSLATGRRLIWDSETFTCVGDDEATAITRPGYEL